MPGFATSVRNAWLDAITTAVNAGAGPGLVRVYNGTRPATGAAITTETLLVESTCADPFAPAASAGVLAPTLPATATILASGLASWYRVVTSASGFVWDGDVGVDMSINFPNLVLGEPFDITSWSITAPNP